MGVAEMIAILIHAERRETDSQGKIRRDSKADSISLLQNSDLLGAPANALS